MQANKLEHIFELQDKLNSRFGWGAKDLALLPEDERLQRVRNFLEALTIEVGEALKAAGGRWWKKEKDWQGNEHLLEELIDCQHFLTSAILAAGGDAEKCYEKYIQKNQQNHTRKDWQINHEPTQANSGESNTA